MLGDALLDQAPVGLELASRPGRRGSRSRRAGARDGSRSAPAGSSDRSDARARPAARLRGCARAGRRFPGSARCGRAPWRPRPFRDCAAAPARARSPSPRCRPRRLLTRPAISSTLPLPMKVAGRMSPSGTMPDCTTSRSMARASPTASSSCASGERNASSRARSRAARRPAAQMRLDDDRAAGRRALSAGSGDQRAYRTGGVPTQAFLRRRLLGAFEQLDRMTRHDGRDRVLVDELGMPIAPQQHAEIIEPGHDALQLDAVHQEDRERSFVLADMVEEGVLQILCAFGCHCRCSVFCSRAPSRETLLPGRSAPRCSLSLHEDLDRAITWHVLGPCKHKLGATAA